MHLLHHQLQPLPLPCTWRIPVATIRMSGRVLSAGPVSSEGDARPARWMTLTAGAFAGAFEACLVFPVENVKTQLQLPRTPPFAGPLDCIRTTLRTHGPAGFYTGISAAATGAIVKASVRFFTFDSIKRAAFRAFPLPPPPAPGASAPTRSRAHAPLVTVLSGLAAGVVEAVVAVTPSECIKTKLIHDRAQSAPQHGSLTALVGAIAREEGIRGFYHGLGPTVVRQGANQAVRFSVYTAAAAAMMRRNASMAAGSGGKAGKSDMDGEGGAVGQLGSGQALLAGALAGFVSVYVTMPIDVVKVRISSSSEFMVLLLILSYHLIFIVLFLLPFSTDSDAKPCHRRRPCWLRHLLLHCCSPRRRPPPWRCLLPEGHCGARRRARSVAGDVAPAYACDFLLGNHVCRV